MCFAIDFPKDIRLTSYHNTVHLCRVPLKPRSFNRSNGKKVRNSWDAKRNVRICCSICKRRPPTFLAVFRCVSFSHAQYTHTPLSLGQRFEQSVFCGERDGDGDHHEDFWLGIRLRWTFFDNFPCSIHLCFSSLVFCDFCPRNPKS